MKPSASSDAALLSRRPPSRLRLFACMMYEAVLLFGVVFFADYIFDTLTQSRSGLTLLGTRQAVLFVAIGLYFVLCWRKHGQTLPMKTWNIRLVSRQGAGPALGKLVLRYVLCWPMPLLGAYLVYLASNALGWPSITLFIVFTPFLNFVYSWFDRDGLMLHDRLAGTRLVDLSPAAIQ